MEAIVFSGGYAYGYYSGPTNEHQATIFSNKAALIADNSASVSLKNVDVILDLKIYLPTTEEARVVLCRGA